MTSEVIAVPTAIVQVWARSFRAPPIAMETAMKTVVAFALLLTACAASAGPTSAPARHADAVDPGGVEAVKQVAQEMGDAMVAGNVDGLARIYSDDFVSIGFSGKTTNKQSLLTSFSSFHPTLLWYQLGPTDAQVFGRFAVSQGSV